MASAIERRRAAKAARRKAVVALKRKLARGGQGLSLAQRVRLAAHYPIHACFSQEGLFERGNGIVTLARLRPAGDLIIAVFLVDAWCLGVKDVTFRELERSQFEFLADNIDETAPLVPVEAAYARKLLREAVADARSFGFPPHRDYAAVDAFFGDVSADTCDAVFSLGHDGKPFYVAGPHKTAVEINKRTEQLHRQLGPDGFDTITPIDFVAAEISETVARIAETLASGLSEDDPALAPCEPKTIVQAGHSSGNSSASQRAMAALTATGFSCAIQWPDATVTSVNRSQSRRMGSARRVPIVAQT